LKIDPGDRIGPTQIQVKIKRKHATKDQEEVLEIESVTGVVAGRGRDPRRERLLQLADAG